MVELKKPLTVQEARARITYFALKLVSGIELSTDETRELIKVVISLLDWHAIPTCAIMGTSKELLESIILGKGPQ